MVNSTASKLSSLIRVPLMSLASLPLLSVSLYCKISVSTWWINREEFCRLCTHEYILHVNVFNLIISLSLSLSFTLSHSLSPLSILFPPPSPSLPAGQFGQVFRAMLKHGVAPIKVAVKTAKKSSSSKEKVEFMREMTIMSQMMHPNIVRLYGVVQQGEKWVYIYYQEYILCSNCTGVIKACRQPPPCCSHYNLVILICGLWMTIMVRFTVVYLEAAILIALKYFKTELW